ncbi:transcription antitermination factor NusB [Virgibacillus halophilus]|uniref:Transcription antitermination factor NusB n=1 Tax=Tigheibacillus halophilus TaxID=361280 RepID=A0ABU5CBB7_9BACI|nr:transcription antitermination factor NusB [Virgibacillus halophilus]
MEKLSLRKSMLSTLERIENGGYSHLLIDHEIKTNQFSTKDAALLTEVVYGTMQRKLTLDFYLNQFLTNGAKIKDWVRILLKMSVYQMVYLKKSSGSCHYSRGCRNS